MTRVFYTTRESVKAALDIKEVARSNGQVDRAIMSGSDIIDGGDRIGGLLRRRFYPTTATRYFDWPAGDYSRSWRLWFNQHELISASLVVAGGTTIASSDYFLRPYYGPPYTHIEIDLGSSAAFAAGSTHQQAIAITGVWGSAPDSDPAGSLAAVISSTTATTCTASDSSLIGVGHVLYADSERMLVTGKTMADTGQNSSALTAANNAVSITGVTAGTIAVDETILVDSERMLVVDVAGTTLTVQRAYDGTVLASHSNGADIYAPRTLTVTRGALGSTAATHSNGATLTRLHVPDLVRELADAEALNILLQRRSGYARTVGAGENQREAYGKGLRDLRAQAVAAHGRTMRKRAV